MYISLNWVKEFVDLRGISVDELVTRFGLSTAEVEGVEYKGKELDKIVVAKILTVENHPNSNHLHILTVDDGSGVPVQVVCGAPNVRVGLKTYFAQVGGNVNGLKIKPAKLAGVESFGMCCGGNELGIESDESGIVELDDSCVIGTNIKDILPVEDVIIEIDNKSLTNRPDLWGHYGIAREFSAIFKRPLKKLECEDLSKYQNLKPIDISVETDNCFRYCALTVDNVITKTSSPLMKLRLNYCGMRDINLLADMTNYLMLEMGQPMHAFDNSIVKDITVVETKEDIKMTTLEGEEHTIEPNTLVICNKEKEPVAIAGIKGGLKSGISENTTSLLLESACFDSATIRKASRKIGLITDASLRYEKSLDPEMCKSAIERLVYLLKQIEPRVVITSSLTDVYNYHYPKNRIKITADFVSRRGGVALSVEQIVDYLTRLGFKVEVLNEEKGEMEVEVPSFRATKDVSIKEDLVEEIFRLYGYDNIKSATIDMPLQPVEQISKHTIEYAIKYALASNFGLNEVHSYIWNYEDFNKSVGIEQESVVRLLDSSKSGQSGIRAKLVPTMLKFLDENKNKFEDIGIFEIGRTVEGLDENNLVIEKKKLAILLASETRSNKELYFKLKEIVEFIGKNIAKCDLQFSQNNENNKLYHPINSCKIVCNGQTLGEMGILYPSIEKNIDKRKKIAILELDVNMLTEMEQSKFSIKPTSKFQSVSMDFNFVADENMPYGEIEKALCEFRANYILEHSLKDVYVNNEVLKDKISYTINYIITPKDKTLQTSDLEKFSLRLIDYMKKLGVELRK